MIASHMGVGHGHTGPVKLLQVKLSSNNSEGTNVLLASFSVQNESCK